MFDFEPNIMPSRAQMIQAFNRKDIQGDQNPIHPCSDLMGQCIFYLSVEKYLNEEKHHIVSDNTKDT